jgi:hypothetical protein
MSSVANVSSLPLRAEPFPLPAGRGGNTVSPCDGNTLHLLRTARKWNAALHAPSSRLAATARMGPQLQYDLVLAASIGFVVLAFIDFGFYPVAWWLFLLVIVLFALGLLRRKPLKEQIVRVAVLLLLVSIATALYFVPWPGRKVFLRDLYKIKAGMSEAEVRQIMGKHIEGTGWPAVYGGAPAGTGTLTDLSTGATHATGATSTGEMTIQGSLVFRPSNRAGDSDWGIVAFQDGRVTNVSFSPD